MNLNYLEKQDTGKKRSLLWAIFITGYIIQGLTFVFQIPPWQSADEPTYFEAFIVHAKHAVDNKNVEPDPILESEILSSMKRHSFWRRIGIPVPGELPARFSQCFFLKSAPSKLGRSTVFYYLSGIPAYLIFPDNVLGQLYVLRIFNVMILITGLCIILKTTQNLFPDTLVPFSITGVSLFIFTTLWQMGATVNIESVLLCINAFGLLIASTYLLKKEHFPWFSLFLFFIAGMLIKWTHVFSALPILIFLFMKRQQTFRMNSRRKISEYLAGALLIVGAGMICVLLSTSPELRSHEMGQALLLMKEIPRNLTAISSGMWHRLYHTFWWGIGWLTMSPPRLCSFFYIILSCLIGIIFILELLIRDKLKDLNTLGLLLSVTIFTVTAIRSTASDRAVQGRYLFPLIPYIAVLTGMGMNRWVSLTVEHKKKILASFFLFIGITGVCAFSGLLVDYYHKPFVASEFSRRLSKLQWISPENVSVYVNFANPQARVLLRNGWYAAEPGPLVWMRNTAAVDIPLLPRTNLFVRCKIKAFLPAGKGSRNVEISFNHSAVFENRFTSGTDGYISFHVPENLVSPALNTLVFRSDSTASPFDSGISNDPRPLSIGLFDIWIVDERGVSVWEDRLSGWGFTSDASTLSITEGNGLNIYKASFPILISGLIENRKMKIILVPGARHRVFRQPFTLLHFKVSVPFSRGKINYIAGRLSDCFFALPVSGRILYGFYVCIMVLSILIVYRLVV